MEAQLDTEERIAGILEHLPIQYLEHFLRLFIAVDIDIDNQTVNQEHPSPVMVEDHWYHQQVIVFSCSIMRIMFSGLSSVRPSVCLFVRPSVPL